MLYVRFSNNVAVEALTHKEGEARYTREQWEAMNRTREVQSRWDWHGPDGGMTVTRIAEQLTQATGRTYLCADSGPSVSPRFDVIEAPKMGDAVSYAFNGDYYPCGHVTYVGKGYKLIRATDERGTVREFRRRKESGSWIMTGGTWSLVPGHKDERNPHF